MNRKTTNELRMTADRLNIILPVKTWNVLSLCINSIGYLSL